MVNLLYGQQKLLEAGHPICVSILFCESLSTHRVCRVNDHEISIVCTIRVDGFVYDVYVDETLVYDISVVLLPGASL